MSVTRDLFNGMAALLVAGTSDLMLPASNSGLTPVQPLVQTPTPDRQLVITPVQMTDNIGLPLGLVMFQLKGRGNIGQPLDTADLLDECFPLLHNLKDVTWGSTHIIQMYRTISIPSTEDEIKRWERIDQYYADVDYPATALRNATGY